MIQRAEYNNKWYERTRIHCVPEKCDKIEKVARRYRKQYSKKEKR
jgi:hypothetical protein